MANGFGPKTDQPVIFKIIAGLLVVAVLAVMLVFAVGVFLRVWEWAF